MFFFCFAFGFYFRLVSLFFGLLSIIFFFNLNLIFDSISNCRMFPTGNLPGGKARVSNLSATTSPSSSDAQSSTMLNGKFFFLFSVFGPFFLVNC
jgi:hypothetical protein